MRRVDPHLNVFHPYRGPSTADGSVERQLENNLTRALAVCLTRLAASNARTRLLEAFGILRYRAQGFERCDLQVSKPDANWPPPSKRSIAVVTGTAADLAPAPHPAANGVLDLVIVGTDFVLGVESKIGSMVTHGQLAAHAKTLQTQPADAASVTWTSLARRAREILSSEVMQPVPRFVLQQFEDYLRMNGFGGFTNDHFAFFALTPDEREQAGDTRVAIRRQMRELVQGLKIGLASNFVENVGRITNTGADAYAALKPPSKARRARVSRLICRSGSTPAESRSSSTWRPIAHTTNS
jgi:hypothetical protein